MIIHLREQKKNKVSEHRRCIPEVAVLADGQQSRQIRHITINLGKFGIWPSIMANSAYGHQSRQIRHRYKFILFKWRKRSRDIQVIAISYHSFTVPFIFSTVRTSSLHQQQPLPILFQRPHLPKFHFQRNRLFSFCIRHIAFF